MKTKASDMIKKIFNWIFKEHIEKLQKSMNYNKNLSMELEKQIKHVNNILSGIDVSVDVHEYRGASSWAVICINGQKSDYIRFVELGNKDIHEISMFLRQFERSKNIRIDASPNASRFLKISK